MKINLTVCFVKIIQNVILCFTVFSFTCAMRAFFLLDFKIKGNREISNRFWQSVSIKNTVFTIVFNALTPLDYGTIDPITWYWFHFNNPSRYRDKETWRTTKSCYNDSGRCRFLYGTLKIRKNGLNVLNDWIFYVSNIFSEKFSPIHLMNNKILIVHFF